MEKTDLTQARVKELLEYHPEIGVFIWRVSPNKRILAGTIAGGHAERSEDFAFDPGGEIFAGDGFEGLAEENEAEVRVLGAFSGEGGEGQFKAGAEQSIGAVGSGVERHIAGKAGGVREQVTNGDVAGPLSGVAADDKAGEEVADAGVKVELAALMEEHGGGGGGGDLGDAGDVEEGVGCDRRGVGLVGEVSEGVGEDEFAVDQETESAAGEGFVRDGLAQDVVGLMKSGGLCGFGFGELNGHDGRLLAS